MIVRDSLVEGSGSDRPLADRLADHTLIVWTMAKREVKSRFGQNALGYAWTYVIPLLWIGVSYLFFDFFGRRVPVYTDLVTFIMSGLIPYLGFRMVIGTLQRVNGAAKGIVIYPSVTREHAAVAMGLVELVNIFIIFAIVGSLNYLIFGNFELDEPLHFATGVGLAWGLGAAYGYLFATLGLINVTFQHISGPLLRPAIFLSGIFFTANELPEQALRIFAWNPILHAVEYARDGMLFHYQSRIASPLYVLGWTAAMFAIAFVVRRTQRG